MIYVAPYYVLPRICHTDTCTRKWSTCVRKGGPFLIGAKATVPNHLARNTLLAAVLELAAEQGVSRKDVLSELELDEATATLPGFFVRSYQLIDAVEFAAQATGRKDFGLALSGRRDHRMLGPLGTLIENCRSVREVIDEAVPYLHLHNTALRYELHRRRAQYVVRLQVNTRGTYPPRHYVEALLSGCVRLCRVWLGEDWTPMTVTLEHARLGQPAAYQQIFGKHIEFEAPMNSIVAKRSDFERRIPLPETSEKILVKRLLDDLNQTRSQPLAPRVGALLRISIPTSGATAGTIAKQVGLSPRTLQRRLNQEGTTFSKEVIAARLRLAEDHVARLSLGELATLLGFSESSAVSRFIKAHVGRSPREWRHKLQRAKAQRRGPQSS